MNRSPPEKRGVLRAAEEDEGPPVFIGLSEACRLPSLVGVRQASEVARLPGVPRKGESKQASNEGNEAGRIAEVENTALREVVFFAARTVQF